MSDVIIKRTRRYVTATHVPSIVECTNPKCRTKHAENRPCPNCEAALQRIHAKQAIASLSLPEDEYDKPVYAPINCGWNIAKDGVCE